MDQRDHQYLEPLSICNRLYNFIMRSLATQAFKTVTLGCSSSSQPHHFVAKGQSETVAKATPFEKDQTNVSKEPDHLATFCSSSSGDHKQDGKMTSRADLGEEKSDASVSFEMIKSQDQEARSIGGTSLRCLLAAEAKPPKKVVSINDRVEEIDVGKKKKITRKGSNVNLGSYEGQGDGEKPLRSILKVGTKNLGGKASSFASYSF
ncbi:unnamed protein product [Linum trigynum]|uniref:Uncharacterized protein n=1 Tax=Linum trigynum TaxID=586398 RepID=A0AAV2G9D2_9ROSI